MLALGKGPQHERSWARGAGGEELVAWALAERCPDVPALHDRRMPGSPANIDRLALAPTGVWVLDAKRYKGKVEVARALLGRPRLKVGGRDGTKLVAGLAKQVEAVRGG